MNLVSTDDSDETQITKFAVMNDVAYEMAFENTCEVVEEINRMLQNYHEARPMRNGGH